MADATNTDVLNGIMNSPDPADGPVPEDFVFTPEPSVDELMFGSFEDETVAEAPVVAEVEGADESEEEAAGPRASKRIKQLVAEKKEAQVALDTLRQQVAYELKQQQDRFAAQMDDVRKANTQLAEQMKSAQQSAPKQPISPLQEWEGDFRGKIREEYRADLQAAVAPYQEKLNKLETELATKAANEARAVRLSHFKAEAEQARQDTLLKDFAPEDAAALARASDEFILTAAAAFQVSPKDAATELAKYQERYFKARLKAMQAKAKASVQKNGSVPNVSAAARVGGAGSGAAPYTYAQIKAAGYKNDVDAVFDNYRKMRPGA